MNKPYGTRRDSKSGVPSRPVVIKCCFLVLTQTFRICLFTFNVFNVVLIEYLGCYEDSDPRDLPQRVHGREITVRSCAKSCKDLYYRYAGLQFSYLCFCGNKRGRYGMLPEWKCSSECSNKKDKHCGGYWSNSIYKTGKRNTIPCKSSSG